MADRGFPVHCGRVLAGEAFDPDLRQRLDGEPDVLRRQLIVLDWFFERFEANLPPEAIIRYENVVESGDRALFRRLGHPGAEPVALEGGNASRVYEGVNVDVLLTALLKARGAGTRLYPPATSRPPQRRSAAPPTPPPDPEHGAPRAESRPPRRYPATAETGENPAPDPVDLERLT